MVQSESTGSKWKSFTFHFPSSSVDWHFCPVNFIRDWSVHRWNLKSVSNFHVYHRSKLVATAKPHLSSACWYDGKDRETRLSCGLVRLPLNLTASRGDERSSKCWAETRRQSIMLFLGQTYLSKWSFSYSFLLPQSSPLSHSPTYLLSCHCWIANMLAFCWVFMLMFSITTAPFHCEGF